jgi:hypothetical protein
MLKLRVGCVCGFRSAEVRQQIGIYMHRGGVGP